MARPYTVSFENVAVAAIQDLFNLAIGAAGILEVREVNISQRTLTGWEALRLTIKRMTATVTNGTGGTTPTPAKHLNGDAAATATCRANDMTTQATSSGATTVVRPDMWMVLNPYQYVPSDFGDRLILSPNQNLIMKLEVAPSASMNCDGSIVFDEVF